MYVSAPSILFVLMIVMGLVFTSIMLSKRHGNRAFLLLCLIPLFLILARVGYGFKGGFPARAIRTPFHFGISMIGPLELFIVFGTSITLLVLLSQKHRHARVLRGIVLALIVFGFLTTMLRYHHIVPTQTRSTAWVKNSDDGILGFQAGPGDLVRRN